MGTWMCSLLPYDDKIAWYENQGGGVFGAQQIITTQADGAKSVYAADLDGDGDQDVLSASLVTTRLLGMRIKGRECSELSRSSLRKRDGARSVHTADLDGDGDHGCALCFCW